MFKGMSTTEQEKGRYPGNISRRAFSLVFPLILSFVLHNRYPFFDFSISCVSFPSITIYPYLSLRYFALFTLCSDELGRAFFFNTQYGTWCHSILSCFFTKLQFCNTPLLYLVLPDSCRVYGQHSTTSNTNVLILLEVLECSNASSV